MPLLESYHATCPLTNFAAKHQTRRWHIDNGPIILAAIVNVDEMATHDNDANVTGSISRLAVAQ